MCVFRIHITPKSSLLFIFLAAPGTYVQYMTVDMLLETLDHEEPPPKTQLLLQYCDQFDEHRFCTVNDLLEMEFFTPKDFRSLFMPALHIGTSLCIMRHAKEEVEYAWNAFISRDHL